MLHFMILQVLLPEAQHVCQILHRSTYSFFCRAGIEVIFVMLLTDKPYSALFVNNCKAQRFLQDILVCGIEDSSFFLILGEKQILWTLWMQHTDSVSLNWGALLSADGFDAASLEATAGATRVNERGSLWNAVLHNRDWTGWRRHEFKS